MCGTYHITKVMQLRERRNVPEKKKMGRPTDSPKNYRESFRLSEADMQKIKFCMEKTGKSKTEIIRMGIEEVYQMLN